MAIKTYEAGTRFYPEGYVIALVAHDDANPEKSAFAIGIEIRIHDDVVKLQSPIISLADCTPVTDFGFQNYD